MAIITKHELLHGQLNCFLFFPDHSGPVSHLLPLQVPGDGDVGFVPGKPGAVTQQLLLHIPTESGQEGKSSKGCLTQ